MNATGRRSGFEAAAAEGALAGMAVGLALGGWASRVNADEPLRMAWLVAGRVLPCVARLGAAGILVSLALAGGVSAARRAGRGAGIAAGVVTAVLAGVGAWLALGPYRGVVFPYERASTPRLTFMVMTAVVGAAVALALFRAAGGLFARPPAGLARFGRATCLALCGVWLAASVAHVAYPAAGSWRARGKPSIIVVSLDTLRADRLGFLGNTRGLTPRLDALAAEGVVFERAIAPAPWTLATHASLFTSKLPFDHHARLDFQKVAPQQRMLAEDLRQAGYRTAAFTADGYVAATFGFGQGFEIYDESDDRADDALARTLGLALTWLRARKGEPSFAFVHTYEVHSPYTHADRADPAMRGRLGDRFTNVEIEDIRAGRLTLTPDEREWVRGLYDGDVAYADRLVGEFLETLRRDGILDDAILVVLSDHGDDLWDHSVERSPGHGHSLYQELIHVPLFVRWPNAVAAGARIDGYVSLLDVAPTLLDLAGVPRDPAHRGRSLAASCRAGSEPEPRAVTAESTEYGPDRFAILEGRYKAIFTPWPEDRNMGVALQVAPLEIFDLAADPHERDDLSSRLGELPPEVLHLVATVRARAAEKRPTPNTDDGKSPEDAPSEELLQRLKALGYVQ